MRVSQESSSNLFTKSVSAVDTGEQRMRAIAYSLDALVPSPYAWCGLLKTRLGGSSPEENYPGTIHSTVGMAAILTPCIWPALSRQRLIFFSRQMTDC